MTDSEQVLALDLVLVIGNSENKGSNGTSGARVNTGIFGNSNDWNTNQDINRRRNDRRQGQSKD